MVSHLFFLSNFRYPLSDTRYPIPVIRYPLSVIRYPIPVIRYSLSDIRLEDILNLQSRDSRCLLCSDWLLSVVEGLIWIVRTAIVSRTV